MTDILDQANRLLHEVAETHHRVFRLVDGADDDWASWYADWLVNLSELPALLKTKPVRSELTPPLGHRLDRHPQFPGGLGIRHPPGTRQDDPGPVSPPAPRQPSPAQQLSPLIFRQHDPGSRRTRMRHDDRLAEITPRISGAPH